jgi:hypothetical protein
MVADVTERKRSEERLREVREAVEGAEDMIGVIGPRVPFSDCKPSVFEDENLTGSKLWGISFLRYWVGKYLRLSSNLNWMSVSKARRSDTK